MKTPPGGANPRCRTQPPLGRKNLPSKAHCKRSVLFEIDAIARKARDLVSAKKEEKKEEEVGCFGLTSRGSKKEPSPPVETLAIEEAPAVNVDAEKGNKLRSRRADLPGW